MLAHDEQRLTVTHHLKPAVLLGKTLIKEKESIGKSRLELVVQVRKYITMFTDRFEEICKQQAERNRIAAETRTERYNTKKKQQLMHKDKNANGSKRSHAGYENNEDESQNQAKKRSVCSSSTK